MKEIKIVEKKLKIVIKLMFLRKKIKQRNNQNRDC